MPDSEDGDAFAAPDTLATALREAGAIALRTFRTPIKSWLKDQSSPVTEADMAIDGFLRQRLAGPGRGWLSEETAEDRSSLGARRLWIVDPIDGTRSYLAGRDDWVISAALVENGRPILAGVFAPTTDELFLGAAGKGATRNGVPIRASAGNALSNIRVAGPKRLVQALASRQPQIIVAPRIGSLALRLIRVAQGELDVAFASASSHDWDLAGADLLVHEAGGVLTNLVGRGLTYNQPDLVHGALVSAGAERHAALLALTREWSSEFG
ncbi:MAG TPA: 3'(2'),5'-bisphosphate nucleotidase CysQ [Xanthobacteraceae bacterium]|nr:3'(2'),5'-bisphosphate nucleotidase CysQ [Xanthobacteraceae bacterium]